MLLNEFLQEYQIKEIYYGHEVFDYFLYLLKKNINLKKAIKLSLKESYGIELDILDYLAKKLEESPIKNVEKIKECIDIICEVFITHPAKSNITQLIYLATVGKAVMEEKNFFTLYEKNINIVYDRKAG